jgi:glycosyltransferase involved in cell wall biosynthesis
MAFGLPVVASAAGGPVELITDGVDGLLFPPGDVEAMAAILTALDADPERRRRIGRAARRRAREFLPERAAERVIDLYTSTLNRS